MEAVIANFISVIHLDTLELAGSLRTRWGHFKTEAPGHRILRIRGHAKDSEEADDRFANYAPTKGWVELSNMRSEIALLAATIMPPGIEYGRIVFEMLDPGASLGWNRETAPYFDRWTRAILPLRANPATLFVYGSETMIPQIGWLTVVTPRLPHCAINMGAHPLVWLTMDFRRKDSAE